MLFLRTSILLQRSLCQRYISQEHRDVPLDPPEETLILPLYKRNSNEDVKTLKSRLVYQSRKRGMLENGLILSNFATKYLSNMNKTQLELYDRLINTPSNDWDLYYWATGMKNTPMEFDNEVMDLLKEFVRNVDRESRATQPDL